MSQDECLEWLKENKEGTAKMIAACIGLSPDAVQHNLQALRKNKLAEYTIVRNVNGKGGLVYIWRCVE